MIGVFFQLSLPLAAALASSHCISYQCAPLQIKIDERKADLQTVEVLGDTAIADFAESEHAFENAEWMLIMGADARGGAIFGDLFLAEG